MIYKAQSKQEMSKVTTTLDSVDIQRVKWAQQLTNKASSYSITNVLFYTDLFSFPDKLIIILSVSLQYKYTDLAARERAHFTPELNTPNMGHVRKMKVVCSDVSLHLPHFFFILT